MKNFLILAILGLVGCANPRAPANMAVYDFGVQRLTAVSSTPGESESPRLQVSLLVPEAVAPIWLDSTAIQYRLAYRDLAQVYAYANTRWAAAPATLLTQRIRNRIAMINDNGVASAAEGVRTDYALRLELEEFTQIFDTADRSRAVVKFRASLIDRRTRLLAGQRSFNIEQSAPAPNASGAVRALADASDQLISSLIGWLAEELSDENERKTELGNSSGLP